MSSDRWIAQRMRPIEASGIRKVFDLARRLATADPLDAGTDTEGDAPEVPYSCSLLAKWVVWRKKLV